MRYVSPSAYCHSSGVHQRILTRFSAVFLSYSGRGDDIYATMQFWQPMQLAVHGTIQALRTCSTIYCQLYANQDYNLEELHNKLEELGGIPRIKITQTSRCDYCI
jgi:hypothetical protein